MNRLTAIAAALLALAAIQPAFAQTYPQKPVRLVVPSSPGGGTDIVGRAIAQRMSQTLGQSVVVDNRAGAGTMIGNEHVAKSAPDGYTLLMGVSTLAIIPAMHPNVRYNALTDLAPISLAVRVPNVLVVHPSVPARSVKELIALAKTKKLNAGSAGPGTSPHLSLELFKSMAEVDLVHVPYKGSGQSMLGLLRGEVDVLFASLPTVMPNIRAEKIFALGVTTPSRSKGAPDIPTIAEGGLPGYEATQWFGVLAPAGTARPIIDLLHKHVSDALRSPEVTKHLTNEGADVVASSPEQFADYLRTETEKWGRVVKAAGIQAEDGR